MNQNMKFDCSRTCMCYSLSVYLPMCENLCNYMRQNKTKQNKKQQHVRRFELVSQKKNACDKAIC